MKTPGFTQIPVQNTGIFLNPGTKYRDLLKSRYPLRNVEDVIKTTGKKLVTGTGTLDTALILWSYGTSRSGEILGSEIKKMSALLAVHSNGGTKFIVNTRIYRS